APRLRGCGCCRACPCNGSLVSEPVSFLPRADLPFLRLWEVVQAVLAALGKPRDTQSSSHARPATHSMARRGLGTSPR
ncbi:hypothetical protein H8958_006000, partial [Nasalis larvatus]